MVDLAWDAPVFPPKPAGAGIVLAEAELAADKPAGCSREGRTPGLHGPGGTRRPPGLLGCLRHRRRETAWPRSPPTDLRVQALRWYPPGELRHPRRRLPASPERRGWLAPCHESARAGLLCGRASRATVPPPPRHRRDGCEPGLGQRPPVPSGRRGLGAGCYGVLAALRSPCRTPTRRSPPSSTPATSRSPSPTAHTRSGSKGASPDQTARAWATHHRATTKPTGRSLSGRPQPAPLTHGGCRPAVPTAASSAHSAPTRATRRPAPLSTTSLRWQPWQGRRSGQDAYATPPWKATERASASRHSAASTSLSPTPTAVVLPSASDQLLKRSPTVRAVLGPTDRLGGRETGPSNPLSYDSQRSPQRAASCLVLFSPATVPARRRGCIARTPREGTQPVKGATRPQATPRQ